MPSSGQPPRQLLLVSPNGEGQCAGTYSIVPNRLVNGFPIWRQQDGKHWLFSGLDGMWLFGGDAEYQLDFRCDEGFIASTDVHHGAYPHDVGVWQRDDGLDWKVDLAVKVFAMDDAAMHTTSASVSETPEEAAAAATAHSSPELLIVCSPNGEQQCEGEYALVAGRTVNGHPLWKQKGGEHWIFSSLEGTWLFGGPEEKELSFQCDYGLIATCQHHLGKAPHEIEGGWQRDTGTDWIIDPDISVISASAAQSMQSLTNPGRASRTYPRPARNSLANDLPRAGWIAPAPQTLLVEAPAGEEDCAGKYVIVNNELANGMPFWKCVDKPRWLFSSVGGMWLFGGTDEKAQNFECEEGYIATLTEHGGVMPDGITTGWQRDDGRSWFRDDDVRVTSNGEQRLGPGWDTVMPDKPSLIQSPLPPPASPLVPVDTLYLSSPSGQQQCAGQYDAVHDWCPNGFPLWKHVEGDHWLYSGVDGVWLIGGVDEYAQNFLCDEGLVASTDRHRGIMPHELAKRWGQNCWQRDTGTDWFVDPSISVTDKLDELIPQDLHVIVPQDVEEIAGYYERVQDELANGFPFWKQLGGKRYWIFSDAAGVWLLGGAAEKECLVQGAEPHDGRMPDHSPGGWMKRDGGISFRWAVDSQIVVTQAGFTASAVPSPSAKLPKAAPVELPSLMAISVPSDVYVNAGDTPLDCEGHYELRPGYVNGAPQWEREDGQYYLFTGTDQKWIFAGISAKKERFQVESGVMVSVDRHNGVMPDNYHLSWMRCDTDDTDKGWYADPGVEITTRRYNSAKTPETLFVQDALYKAGNTVVGKRTAVVMKKPMDINEESAPYLGRYDLAHGEFANGMPLWRHTGGSYFISSSTDGRWLLGGEKEKQAQFAVESGIAQSTQLHKGTMPHLLHGGWDPALMISGRSSTSMAKAPRAITVQAPAAAMQCAGCYDLRSDLQANGYPVWEQRGGVHWLFSGLEGDWVFGDADARKIGFRCTEGLINSADLHDGLMPDRISVGWLVASESGKRTLDASIAVLPDVIDKAPPVLYALAPNGEAQMCAGRYDLVPNKWANGYPVWKQYLGEHWIFSSVSGKCWLFGGPPEEAQEFHTDAGMVASIGVHKGAMPDEVEGGWQRDGTLEWIEDKAIKVTTEVPTSLIGAEAHPRPEVMQLRHPNSGELITTELHTAAFSGQVAACTTLLNYKVFDDKKVNATDAEGRTALHLGAIRGSVEVCQAILDHPRFTAMDIQDFGGWTALHCAVWRGHSDVCELLMEHQRFKALEAVDVLGRSALDLESRLGLRCSQANIDFGRFRRQRLPEARSKELRNLRMQASFRGVGVGWDEALMEEEDDDGEEPEDVGSDDEAFGAEYWDALPLTMDAQSGDSSPFTPSPSSRALKEAAKVPSAAFDLPFHGGGYAGGGGVISSEAGAAALAVGRHRRTVAAETAAESRYFSGGGALGPPPASPRARAAGDAAVAEANSARRQSKKVAKDQQHMDPTEIGESLVQKLATMEKRMRVLENVTKAFWSAAPSDDELKKSGGQVEAMKRWKEAKESALKALQDHSRDMQDAPETEEQARLQTLLEQAWADQFYGDEVQLSSVGQATCPESTRRP